MRKIAGQISEKLEEAQVSDYPLAKWSALQADVVFPFMTPHESDRLNRDEVRSGYAAQAAEHEAITVAVPPVSPQKTTDFILASLCARELLA